MTVSLAVEQLVGAPLPALDSNAKAKKIKRPLDDKEFHRLRIERCQLCSLEKWKCGQLVTYKGSAAGAYDKCAGKDQRLAERTPLQRKAPL